MANLFPFERSKLIILDRDGVINYDSFDYIKSPEEWIPIPGSLEGIAKLNQAGYQVAIATNQSGVGRGLYDIDTLERIHQKLKSEVNKVGGTIAGIFYCPHTPEEECSCRKPQPGLLLKIAEHFKADLKGVPFVGDSLRDVKAARAVGCEPILVTTGKLTEAAIKQNPELADVPVFPDLAAFVMLYLNTPSP